MYNELEKLCLNNKFCSLYCDDDLESFYYGKIIAVNKSEIAMQMISPNGKLDGVAALLLNKICKIEVDGMYDEKMRKLFDFTEIPLIFGNFDNNNIFSSVLQHIMSEKSISSIELMHSGNNDIVGFISEFDDNICKANQIDEYGYADGYAVFNREDITKIVFDSIFERDLLTLFRKSKL